MDENILSPFFRLQPEIRPADHAVVNQAEVVVPVCLAGWENAVIGIDSKNSKKHGPKRTIIILQHCKMTKITTQKGTDSGQAIQNCLNCSILFPLLP